MISREDRAYCAGLFEGEGSIVFSISKKSKGYQSSRNLKLTIRMNDKEPLDLFSELMIFGKVIGPYIRKSNYLVKNMNPLFYHYQVTGLERVQFVVCNLWDWLSPRRKQQIEMALHNFHAFKTTSLPRATWRNRSITQ